ncbi:ROK family transcriptional regulator [Streptacidiphilus jiangxiensis]|uniref:Sugar kinase of the NBD/HSP70 family, may contain an N-terminal HTH domain n=1 Tax=Streptacidiphilus jiangxiensis TaxID=235985 RepID=A0A1H7TCI2_STRJI|nr:ROK family transcriptional regulator [Streptacidiphilus jiangxiensis]SEL82219.1 Sugar kinase of the NBD/HSP70 family, may contain an N-terminal HTH domain [Streptacidiphilus jiangxiensis]
MLPALVATPGTHSAAEQTDGAAAVLRAVLDQGPLARTAIVRRTRQSAAAVSRHAADLLAMGLVWQPPEPVEPPRPGRPRIPLDIDTSYHVAAGVHIAVPRLTFSLTDLRGRVVATEHAPRARRPDAVLAEVAARLPGFLRRHAHGRSVLGLGVVTGGWVDPDAGVLVENAALGWRDVWLRRALEQTVRLPVHVEGHARALAHAELLFGQARQAEENVLVHLFVGNAVDAAIATGGVLLRGRRHGAGGIAHLPVPGSAQACPCGRTGCLQVTVSDNAVAERAAADGITPHADLLLLLRAAAEGDPGALELCRSRLRMVARAVRPMLDVISPDAVVVTEAVTLRLPALLPELSRELGGADGVVRGGSFGTDTLAVAAAVPVLAAVYRDPLGLRTAGAAR